MSYIPFKPKPAFAPGIKVSIENVDENSAPGLRPVPLTPTPTQQTLLTLTAEYNPGSIEIVYYLTSNKTNGQNITLSFTNILGTYTGDSINVVTGVTINSGSTTGSTSITLQGNFNDLNNTSSYSGITVSPSSGITPVSIVGASSNFPTPTISLSQTSTPTPSVTRTLTPTPSSTPGLSPTPSSTSGLTQTPTSSATPTPTPTPTETLTPPVYGPFSLGYNVGSSGVACLASGSDYYSYDSSVQIGTTLYTDTSYPLSNYAAAGFYSDTIVYFEITGATGQLAYSGTC